VHDPLHHHPPSSSSVSDTVSLSTSAETTRFNFLTDIARNPKLVKAARAEANGLFSSSPIKNSPQKHSSSSTDNNNTHAEELPLHEYVMHQAEIDRQNACVKLVDEDAVKESEINAGLSQILLQKLSSSRQACERLLAALTGIVSAELAYSKALLAVSNINLVGNCDGITIRNAMHELSALPGALGEERGALGQQLQQSLAPLHTLLQSLRRASEEVIHATSKSQVLVDSSRKALRSALAIHGEACRAFDEAITSTATATSTSPTTPSSALVVLQVEKDPWLTEGRMVSEQVGLHRAQRNQRSYLDAAFQRVAALERLRVSCVKQVMKTVLDAYESCSFGGTGYTSNNNNNNNNNSISASSIIPGLRMLQIAMDCDGDMDGFTQIAAQSCASADALSARQAETLEILYRDWTTSPEILKQGIMDIYVENYNYNNGGGGGGRGRGMWQPVRCILTRAGVLHWAKPTLVSDQEGKLLGSSDSDNDNNNGEGAFNRRNSGTASSAVGGGVVQGSMSLARASFDAGEAPIFRLVETSGGFFGGKSTKVTLRAPSTEECMQWAIDLREVIAAAK